MARYNSKLKSSRATATNCAGGPAYKQTDALELVSHMLTSFTKNQYYRSGDEAQERLKELILSQKDKEFVAKCAVYTRNEFGMRSVTHFVAAILAHEVKGEKWTKHFYKTVFHRVDDITETVACYLSMYKKPLPNSLKKGIRLAMSKFNNYQLAKYRAEGKDVKLVDVLNLTHPKPVENNKQALNQLIEGELKSEDTWEAMLSAAGSNAQAKKRVWAKLLAEDKLGYFALLRNLRNIQEQAPEVLPQALRELTNEEKIKSSLVLPFRFFTAYNTLKIGGGSREVLKAISNAADLSLKNIPSFEGKTCVVLDHSGSMMGGMGLQGDNTAPIIIGSMFAAALAKKNNADVILFSERAKYASYNSEDSVLTISKELTEGLEPAGTNFDAPFEVMKKAYDRIVILSDMQGWIGSRTPAEGTFKDYCRRSGCKPIIYSFDLTGYGDMQFPQEKVYCLAGFSEKVFGIMRLLESDKNALINTINAVSFSM